MTRIEAHHTHTKSTWCRLLVYNKKAHRSALQVMRATYKKKI
jgi:hypothetical protein